MRSRGPILRDQRGAVAAEFALVIGFAMVTVLGLINGGLMLYSYSNLHMAAETTARWASIRTTIDGAAPGLTDLQAKGAGFYRGATAAPLFAVASATCGMKVTASTKFNLSLGLGSAPIAMSATSCYPLG
jgi:Flp pilus assembly protein TadG